MTEIEKLNAIAAAAREYVLILGVSGQRHSSHEARLFCERVEASDAALPPVAVAEPLSHDVDPPDAQET